MTFAPVKKITAAIHVNKVKELPREEFCLELTVGNVVERSEPLLMTKKASFNHTFTCDMECGQHMVMRLIRCADQSVRGTLTMSYEEMAATDGKHTYNFMQGDAVVGTTELDITVMARVHSGVLDTSIDFLASPLPWFLKSEDIYNLAKKGVTYAHGLPYTEKVVDSLESLTEALLQRTALIHPDEGSSCLTALDHLVAQTLSTADERVDHGRMRVVGAVRGLITAIEQNVNEQREKVNALKTGLQTQVKSHVTTTVTLAKEKMMSTLALYEERYPNLAAKAKTAIARAQAVASGAQEMVGTYTQTVTHYYSSTRETVEHAYCNTHATVRGYYDATVGAAYHTVAQTVVQAPAFACNTLEQGTELVKDVPIVGAYAAPCISTAVGMIRYFTNAPSATMGAGDE